MARKEPVIAEDIAIHPNWVNYKKVALPFGLRSCWSTPIFSTEHDVLGSFAIYYREPHLPTAKEMEWVNWATHLAAMSISRDRNFFSEKVRAFIFQNVADVIFYVAVEGEQFRFVSINSAFLKATGLKDKDIVGKKLHEVIPAPSYELVVSNYKKAIAEKRTVEWQETSVYPAGTKYGDVSITPLFDENGICTHLIGRVHDVTERREAEQKIAQQEAILNAERESRLQAEIRARKAAEESSETKTQFLKNMSHELRTPLSAIMGFSEILLTTNDLHDVHLFAERINRNSGKLMDMIDEILEYSALNRDIPSSNLENFPLTACISEVLEELKPAFDAKKLSVRFNLEPGISIKSDYKRLKKILFRVIDNSIQFTEQGSILIQSRINNDKVEISATDTGIGIAKELQEKVFEPFFQVNMTLNRTYSSLGMGLTPVSYTHLTLPTKA